MVSIKKCNKYEISFEQNYYAEVDFKDWLDLPDRFTNPKINIIKYATKTEKNWLNLSKNRALKSYLTTVDVALIDGCYYKITGLIRAGLWEKELLKPPQTLTLCVYLLDQSSYEELVDMLYPVSLKNKSQDRILECYKELNLSFKSDRIRHGFIADALNIALRGEPRRLQDKRTLRNEIDLYQAIDIFKKELKLIDEINPDNKLFTTGILAAALIMLSLDSQCLSFFKKYNQLEGETQGEKKDPVESLLRIIESLKKKSISEGRFQVEICSKTVRAIHAWSAGSGHSKYWFKRLTNIDFLPDIRKMKALKKIHGNRSL